LRAGLRRGRVSAPPSFAISESAASSKGAPTAPPSVSRDTQVAPVLVAVLRRHLVEGKERALRHGRRRRGCSTRRQGEAGTRLTKQNVERAMTRMVHRAGLLHFAPRSPAPSRACCSSAGRARSNVQQQPGHASLSMTTELYGRWLRAEPIRGGVRALDEALGVIFPGDECPHAV
jgi:integrase